MNGYAVCKTGDFRTVRDNGAYHLETGRMVTLLALLLQSEKSIGS